MPSLQYMEEIKSPTRPLFILLRPRHASVIGRFFKREKGENQSGSIVLCSPCSTKSPRMLFCYTSPKFLSTPQATKPKPELKDRTKQKSFLMHNHVTRQIESRENGRTTRHGEQNGQLSTPSEQAIQAACTNRKILIYIYNKSCAPSGQC